MFYSYKYSIGRAPLLTSIFLKILAFKEGWNDYGGILSLFKNTLWVFANVTTKDLKHTSHGKSSCISKNENNLKAHEWGI